MTHKNIINALQMKMITYFRGDAKRIQHFVKVHAFAEMIGRSEYLSEHERFILESTALLHDIGIKPAEEKYNSTSGKLQEQEGIQPTKTMLSQLDYSKSDIERIVEIVSHHHTYENVTDICHQIILEADFLVNLYEDNLSKESIQSFKQKVFKTNMGKELCEMMVAGNS